MSDFSAKELLNQLGGNKFVVMTGAKNFLKDERSLSFRIPKALQGINYVKISLNSMDTYDMEFGRIRNKAHSVVYYDYKVMAVVNDVYADQLQEIFTEHTGLATHL